jgi:uncharacterized protein YjbI with pentapeptide repeats
MSDAFLYKGFDFECDVSGPLTIEGQDIPVVQVDEWFGTPILPDLKARSVLKLAELVIDGSAEYIRKEEVRKEHLAILREGVTPWNDWRSRNPEIRPTLYEVDLSQKTLGINLSRANFSYADLRQANLREATLIGANFHQANLARADLHKADVTGANFCRADLYETIFSKAKLIDANLQGVQLAKTNFEGACLTRCQVYGMSAWDLNLKDAEQKDLRIRYRYRGEGEQTESRNETEITVEDLQVAQFVYLLLSNKNVRSAIDTITSKVVLILGRFTVERKEILNALRNALRQKDLVPIIFDFAIPTNRDVTQTVKILAGLAKFVVADVTDATEVRAELHDIVPEFPSLPIQPVVLAGKSEFVSLSQYLAKFASVLPTFEYQDLDHLLANLDSGVINPAVVKQRELAEK